MSIDLDRQIEGKGKLRDVLAQEISTVLEEEIENQAPLVKKIQQWQKQFRGEKGEKSFPYPGAANVAIWSQMKVWVVKATKPEFVDFAPHLEDALDWWQKTVKLKKVLHSPLLQAMKMGTGIVELVYKRLKRTIYRRATEEEKRNKDIKKYKAGDNDVLVKVPITQYEIPIPVAISREDWVMSSDSNSIQEAFLAGFRTYLRKPQFEVRVNSGFYPISQEELDQIRGVELDETKKERIESQHKEIQEGKSDKIEIWELWVKYDVDEDGEEDDIVVTFHRDSKTILRAIYNPYFYGFRPFQEFVFDPIEYSFDGVGGCEKLEALQEEIDTLHNQRLDRGNQINAPVYLRNPNFMISENVKDVHPGAIIDCDDVERAMKELTHHDVYPSTERLEALVNQYAQLVMGVSPHVMGQPTAERPVARETMALIQELNKKYKSYIDAIRDYLEELGIRVLEMIAQYQPVYKYKVESGETYEERTLDFFKLGYLRDGIEVKLMASSEVFNTEVRRQINLTIYTLLSDYSTKLAGMAEAIMNPSLPPDFKKFILQVAKIGGDLMESILRDFGEINAEGLVPRIEESIDIQRAITQPPPMPMMPPEEGEEGEGGGAPPMEMMQ